MAANNDENEHLLENRWTYWYRPPALHSQNKDWESNLRDLFEASTVEEFWRGFHKFPKITVGHSVNCDYALFKNGITPAWEHDFNKRGGRWTYSIERRPPNSSHSTVASVIAQSWLDLMLCLIGEGFHPHGESVAGGVCGIRNPRTSRDTKGDIGAKIHVWTRDGDDMEANMKIGQILKEILHAPDNQLVYSPHDLSKKNSYNTGVLKI